VDAQTHLATVLAELEADYARHLADGFQLMDVWRLTLSATEALVQAVEPMTDMDGPAKARFVTDSIAALYHKVNPNLPWIPEPFETWLEQLMLRYLVPGAIDLIVQYFHRSGQFQHRETSG
jgi:hypothetical protein